MKPILFVTGHAPAYRVGGLARLHEREGIEVALFGGRRLHGGALSPQAPPFPHRHVRPRELARLAGGGRYRAVICPTGGRVAPVATWAGARAARVPLLLWASLWAHPRSMAHAFSYLPLRHLYRSADAVVTYGPHVSAYVRARGAHNVHVAPQSVDNDFWRASPSRELAAERSRSRADVSFLFVGRPAREKGLGVLLQAWRRAGLLPPATALILAGVGSRYAASRHEGAAETWHDGVLCLDPLGAVALRDLYASCDVLVLPSIPTRTFREPWGLVVNEAMNRGLPVIASDAVGAVAGGLVRDAHNGLVVPANDEPALAHALRRLADDGALRKRLGEAGRADVRAFDHDAWAAGFSRALASVGVSRGRC